MKYLLILSFALSLISCDEIEITTYEYHTITMMGRTVMAVSQDSVVVTFNGRGEPTYFARETKLTEWEALKASMVSVDLSKVSSLVAPSNKRATDAAPYANFEFVSKDSTLVSSSFDGGNPHVMLKPLMEEFMKIKEENKK
jgi:hypothetical protein